MARTLPQYPSSRNSGSCASGDRTRPTDTLQWRLSAVVAVYYDKKDAEPEVLRVGEYRAHDGEDVPPRPPNPPVKHVTAHRVQSVILLAASPIAGLLVCHSDQDTEMFTGNPTSFDVDKRAYEPTLEAPPRSRGLNPVSHCRIVNLPPTSLSHHAEPVRIGRQIPPTTDQ